MPGEKSPSDVVTADGAKAVWFKDLSSTLSRGMILIVVDGYRGSGFSV
jgi:hypothetical protein